MAHQIIKTKSGELESAKLNYRVNFFTYSPLETSLILADKGSPFGLDDNKLSIKLQTATQIKNHIHGWHYLLLALAQTAFNCENLGWEVKGKVKNTLYIPWK